VGDDDGTGDVVGVGDVVGDGVLVLEVAVLVVPGLAAGGAVTTGGVVAGGDKGMGFAPCAGETDEPAVGDSVADDVPFGFTGLRLQLLTS